VIVYAQGITTAIERAHALGINPGGQVLGLEIAPDVAIPNGMMDRLLGFEELKTLN